MIDRPRLTKPRSAFGIPERIGVSQSLKPYWTNGHPARGGRTASVGRLIVHSPRLRDGQADGGLTSGARPEAFLRDGPRIGPDRDDDVPGQFRHRRDQ
jgi:hypothetical protein